MTKLNKEYEAVLVALEALRPTAHHHEEGDPWYSCAKHPEAIHHGNANDLICTCDFAERNAKADAVSRAFHDFVNVHAQCRVL